MGATNFLQHRNCRRGLKKEKVEKQKKLADVTVGLSSVGQAKTDPKSWQNQPNPEKLMGHLQQWLLLREFFIGSYRRRKRERKPKYTVESEKEKHFCSDNLVDNAQQRSEAL